MLAADGMVSGAAAEMLVLAGDSPGVDSLRGCLRQAARRPLGPALSGKTSRHCLKRSGHRRANAALHWVTTVRVRTHQPTIADVQRRTAKGKSKLEIIRCLKRFVAREILLPLPAPKAISPEQIAA
jgi:transposase